MLNEEAKNDPRIVAINTAGSLLDKNMLNQAHHLVKNDTEENIFIEK